MKTQFENYLEINGYSKLTKSGRKSTIYSYINKIEKVLAWENLTWEGLTNKILDVREQYNLGGINEKKGAMSNSTVINALKAFEKFVNSK